MVLLGLGNYPEAREVLQRAVEADSTHVPALFAAAQLALATAKYCLAQGTPGKSCRALHDTGCVAKGRIHCPT